MNLINEKVKQATLELNAWQEQAIIKVINDNGWTVVESFSKLRVDSFTKAGEEHKHFMNIFSTETGEALFRGCFEINFTESEHD